MSISISKRNLWRYVNTKINRVINHYHVFGVISILFSEIIKDLKDGKQIKIYNFGTLELKKTNPRKYHNVVFKKIMMSNGSKILKFKLAPQIRKKMCKYVDIDKISRNE